MTRKIAIVGSRNWTDNQRIREYIDGLPAKAIIISGGAQGVDSVAATYARKKNYHVIELLADWEKHGRGAGMIRNSEIVEQSDVVIAFWDGESRGTKDTINKALAAPHIKQVVVIKAGQS
jgi:predicted alpha/beta superfamily hydrolase